MKISAHSTLDGSFHISVQKLQAALQAKAKEAPGYRFYLLYDKLYRKDVLEYAYRCCKANAGAPGVDGQDFADIETYGVERWLGELAEKLRGKTYRAEAVRRVWIPKADGSKRPLGVPCIADRTVMTAAVAVLAPIFEVDLPAEQHGYRANFSAHTAVRSVRGLLNTVTRRLSKATWPATSILYRMPSYLNRWRAGSLTGTCCI